MALQVQAWNFDQLVNGVLSLEHATLQFHSRVDEKGLDYFTQASMDITDLYIDQFFGHLNPVNEQSEYWSKIKEQMDVIQAQTMKLMYEDMYELLYGEKVSILATDVKLLLPLLQKVLDDSHAVVHDASEIIKRKKDKESLRGELDEVDDDNTKSSPVCIASEVLNEASKILTIISDPKIVEDLDLLIQAMKGDSLKKYKAWLVKMQALLKEYDPKIELALPQLNQLIKNFEKACDGNEVRELTEKNAAIDWKEIAQFLEKVLEFLQNPPEPLTDDAMKLLMDIIAILAPKKTDVAKDLQVQIVNLNHDLQSFVTTLNNTLVGVQVWSSDVIQTTQDVKTLEQQFQELLKMLVKK